MVAVSCDYLKTKLIIFTLIIFTLGCTSELEKSKILGFNSIWQMKRMKELGFKSREELIEKLPYEITSESTKFAEAMLGQEAEIFGLKRKSDSADEIWFETNNAVVLEANPRVISKIVFHCSGAIGSKGNASIDGVTCGDSLATVRNKLIKYRELCTTSYFEIETYFIIKNKAFFQINSSNRFGVELVSMGIIEDENQLNNRHEEKYIDCNESRSLISKAKSQGFTSVYDMKLAEEKRSNPLKYCKTDWTACLNTEMLVNNYQEYDSIAIRCENATKRIAKWDIDFGRYNSFRSFYNSETDIKEGRIRLIDNDVKFQNGFGAWRRVPVICYYDLKNEIATVVEM